MKHLMNTCGVCILRRLPVLLRRLVPLFFCSLLLPLLPGCTQEDLDPCPVETPLKLSYTFNPTGEDKFAQSVHSGEFFLYGDTDSLLERRTLTHAEIGGAEIGLKLVPGRYTCVLWGGWDPAHYHFKGESTLRGMKLTLAHRDGRVENRPQPLFHASAVLEVRPQTPAPTFLGLRKNTRVIHVILEGGMAGAQPAALAAPAQPAPFSSSSGTTYGISITGSNGVYNCDNTLAPCRKLNYLPQYIRFVHGYKDALGADFTVMRLSKGDDMRIIITNGSKVMQDVSLTESILKSDEINDNDDLDRLEECTLRFSANFVLTGIKVTDWTQTGPSGGGI